VLETPRCSSDLVEPDRCRDLRGLRDNPSESARCRLRRLDPRGALSFPQLLEPRDERVEVATARRVDRDLA